MNRLLAAVVVTVGCGGGSSTPIDAPPDMLIDAPPPPLGHHHYVLDSVLVPTSNTTARDLGQDLNGDQAIDNQLGMVLGTLSSMGLDVQQTTTQNIDRGASITLVDLFANDLTTEPAATFAAFVGSAPMPAACASASDTVCRHHLGGNATFTVTAGAPTNPPLTGALVAGSMTTAPGHLAMPLVMFAGASPVLVNLIGAKVVLGAPAATKLGMLKIGGAITAAEVDTKVIPGMRDGFAAIVMRDCTALSSPPTCGCPASSSGKTILDLFEQAPKDCMVSVTEVKTNSLIQALLAPDVMIDGMMALSIGVKATAVEAGFVAP